MFYVFIWHGNVKIKSSVIVKENYAEGSLQMINIFAFIKALRITWFKRIISNASWKHIPYDKIDMQNYFIILL
jgi:hypothetical protein